MRIFANLAEAVREIERDLAEMGIKSHSATHQNHNVSNNDDYESREIIGYGFKVPICEMSNRNVTQAMEYMGKNPELSMKYCDTEVIDRICGADNPGRSWSIFPELWSQFMLAGKFDYTYYERFHEYQDLEHTIQELINNLESRRAILSIWDSSKDVALRTIGARVPCSMYYQFLIRKVHNQYRMDVIYNMRSCDFYEHFIHDILMTMLLCNYVRTVVNKNLGLSIVPGNVIFHAGSFHMFKKDYKRRDIF